MCLLAVRWMRTKRWAIFFSLMSWEELEEKYAPQLNPTTGAPANAKPSPWVAPLRVV